jgi:hypothetical protein
MTAPTTTANSEGTWFVSPLPPPSSLHKVASTSTTSISPTTPTTTTTTQLLPSHPTPTITLASTKDASSSNTSIQAAVPTTTTTATTASSISPVVVALPLDTFVISVAPTNTNSNVIGTSVAVASSGMGSTRRVATAGLNVLHDLGAAIPEAENELYNHMSHTVIPCVSSIM